jgi:hypothetical protein
MSPSLCMFKQHCCFICLTLLRSFLDLLIHLISRSLQFARARLQRDTKEELLTWSIPLLVIGK